MHTWVGRCKTSILTSFIELTSFIKCVDKSNSALNFSIWNKFEATWILTGKQAQVYYQSRTRKKLLSTPKNNFWYETQIDLEMELLITLHLMEVQQNKSLCPKLWSWIWFLQTLNCKKNKTWRMCEWQYQRQFSSFLYAHTICFPPGCWGILGLEQARRELCHSLQPCPWSTKNQDLWTALDVISALPSCLHWMLEATACSCCTLNKGSGCQRKMHQSNHTFLIHQSCKWTSNWNEQPAAYNLILGSRRTALANSMLLQIETDGNVLPCQSCYSPRAKRFAVLNVLWVTDRERSRNRTKLII